MVDSQGSSPSNAVEESAAWLRALAAVALLAGLVVMLWHQIH